MQLMRIYILSTHSVRWHDNELLVTHIRQNITSEQQLVLLSAVLPNSGDIAQWLFEDRGCLATDDSIVSTPKSIGFSSTHSYRISSNFI